MLESYFDRTDPYHSGHRRQFDYLGLRDISSKLVFISDHDMCPYTDFDRSAAFLERCRDTSDRFPVICLDSNPYGDEITGWVERLRSHFGEESFFVLAPDLRPNRSAHPCQAPWPFWLINQQLSPNRQIHREKIYRLSYLSGIARPHRIAMGYGIWPNITDQDVVVVNEFGLRLSEPAWQRYPGIDAEWIQSLPLANRSVYRDQQRSQWNSNSNDHPAFQARINITGETTDHRDLAFFSEKTWKAYKSACLVINYGSDTAPAVLEETGIDIWWEYDQVEDKSQKICRTKELMQRSDLDREYDYRTKQIYRNQYLVNSIEYAQSLCEPAIAKLRRRLNM